MTTDENAMQIFTDIPLPPPARGRGRPPKWPFAMLKVNESFFAPLVQRTSIATQAARAGRLLGFRFRVREWEQDGTPGYMVWRVS